MTAGVHFAGLGHDAGAEGGLGRKVRRIWEVSDVTRRWSRKSDFGWRLEFIRHCGDTTQCGLRLLGLVVSEGLNAFQFAMRLGIGSLHAGLGLPEPVEEGELGFGASGFAIYVCLAHFHASQFPLGDGHLLEVQQFGSGGGLPLGLEFVAKPEEFLTVFAGEDDGAGAQAMTEGVQADNCFSLGCSGAGRHLSVAPIGLDLLECCHNVFF